jgi:beta-phosphoglucomutase family hydrolase
MTTVRGVHRINPDRYDAVLFDLDGVLTATARVHASCWKRMFDGFLRRRAEESGEPFQPFEIATDYTKYVDGKLRQEGIRTFLESRGITLPEGEPDLPPGYSTIHGLGNLKNELFNEVVRAEGVDVYDSSVELVRRLRNLGLETAVVTASKNCAMILKAAGITDLFDAQVDGIVAAALRLPGKPAPETFLKAAEFLRVKPERAVVVEDALSGVAAGRAGGFGLVIGVDRKDHVDKLRAHGADIVVKDLGELLA